MSKIGLNVASECLQPFGGRKLSNVIADAEGVRKKQGSRTGVALPGYLERSDHFS